MRNSLIALIMISWQVFAITANDIAEILQSQPITQGHFAQERLLRGMATPIKSSGTYRLTAGDNLLWALEHPFPTTLKITENGIFQQQADGSWQESQQINSQQMQLFLGLLGGNWRPLENLFEITATGEPSQWKLILMPKGETLKQIFKVISLDGGNMIAHIQIKEAQGDQSDIYFSK